MIYTLDLKEVIEGALGRWDINLDTEILEDVSRKATMAVTEHIKDELDKLFHY